MFEGLIKSDSGHLTTQAKDYILRELENGRTRDAIAQELDVSPQSITKLRQKHDSKRTEEETLVSSSTQALANRAQKLNGIDSLDYRVNLIIAAITPEKVAETKSIKDLTASLKTLFEIQRLHEGKSTKNVSTQTSITGLIESLDDTRKRLRAKRTETNDRGAKPAHVDTNEAEQ